MPDVSGAGVYYEVSVFEKNQVTRHSVKSLRALSDLIRDAQGKNYKVHRIHKSSAGEVLGSEELKCSFHRNSLLIKTIKTKLKTRFLVPKHKRPVPVRKQESRDPGIKKPGKSLREGKPRNTFTHTLRDSKIPNVSGSSSKRTAPRATRIISRDSKRRSLNAGRALQKPAGTSRNSKVRGRN